MPLVVSLLHWKELQKMKFRWWHSGTGAVGKQFYFLYLPRMLALPYLVSHTT